MNFKFFAVVLIVAISVCLTSAFTCVDGTPYEENDCNSCFCSGGNLACTERACLGARFEQNVKCEVGKKWEKDCNKCECVEVLGSICTNNKC